MMMSTAIGLDDVFFYTEKSLEDKDKPLKRGRSSQNKTKVLVMAESKTVENPKEGEIPENESNQRFEVRYNHKECQRTHRKDGGFNH